MPNVPTPLHTWIFSSFCHFCILLTIILISMMHYSQKTRPIQTTTIHLIGMKNIYKTTITTVEKTKNTEQISKQRQQSVKKKDSRHSSIQTTHKTISGDQNKQSIPRQALKNFYHAFSNQLIKIHWAHHLKTVLTITLKDAGTYYKITQISTDPEIPQFKKLMFSSRLPKLPFQKNYPTIIHLHFPLEVSNN